MPVMVEEGKGGRKGRGGKHEVPLLDNPGINSPRAPGVWLAHENGHIMSVGTRGNYISALGAHR